MKRMIWLLTVSVVLAVLPAGLAGCSMEPRSVTMHEPGVYKGAKDPLLALQNQTGPDRSPETRADRPLKKEASCQR